MHETASDAINSVMLSIVYAPFCFLGQTLGHSGNVDDGPFSIERRRLASSSSRSAAPAHDGQRLGGARRHTMRTVRIEGAQVALNSAGVLAGSPRKQAAQGLRIRRRRSHMPATPAIDVPSGWMAPKGHAMAHSLHPMHSCSLTWMRSPSCSMAFTGKPRRRGHPRNGGRQGRPKYRRSSRAPDAAYPEDPASGGRRHRRTGMFRSRCTSPG